jgi:two-component system cell cycle sensor histidine kinase/response regulator CckA
LQFSAVFDLTVDVLDNKVEIHLLIHLFGSKIMHDVQVFVRLAPRMAHHIRDELSIVQTAADLLISNKSIPAKARDDIALIKGYLGHVAGLARQFLINTETEGSHLSVFDIRDVLFQLTLLLQRLLGEGNQLQLALDPDLWPIKADDEQFEEIFPVLAVNAREAMPNGGSLRIRAVNITKSECEAEPELLAIAADYVLIEVADTGVGIPKRNLNKIFDPFFTTKGPGCGFGLATAYGAIKKMNGHFIVESEVGNGTTFRILLPRHLPTIVDQNHT